MEMNRTQGKNPVCSLGIKTNTKFDHFFWKLLPSNMFYYWSS